MKVTEISRTGILQNGVSKATTPRSAMEAGWIIKRGNSHLVKWETGEFQRWSSQVGAAYLFNEYSEAEDVISELGIRAKVVLFSKTPVHIGATLQTENPTIPAARENEIPINFARIAESMTAPLPELQNVENGRKYNPDIPASMRDFFIFSGCESSSDPGDLPEEF